MEAQDTMSYFSSKSTWLSLVDGGVRREGKPARDSDATRLDESHIWGPDGVALPDPDFVAVPAASAGGVRDAAAGSVPLAEEGMLGTPESAEDLDHLRITIDLRHKLFFHFREWEFGPALLEDHMRMARAQTDPEEALAEYCLARHVAVTLVGKLGQEEHRLDWIEADRVIAEIEVLIGNLDSAAVYAREGLKAIKNGRFGAEHDMRITRLAIRFLNILEGR
jgi:hypothetical protein